MKKRLLFAIVLLIMSSIFSTAIAQETQETQEVEVQVTEEVQDAEEAQDAEEVQDTVLEPKIRPQDFGMYTFASAFDWGTDYDTVLNFFAEVPDYDIKVNLFDEQIKASYRKSYMRDYLFTFHEGKLYKCEAKIFSILLYNNYELELISEDLKNTYNLFNLRNYASDFEELQFESENSDSSEIVADKTTIYSIFTHNANANVLGHTDMITIDRNYAETGISLIDKIKADTEAFNARDEVFVDACKYPTKLQIGDTVEVINTTAAQLYYKPIGAIMLGTYAYPDVDITITNGPVCANNSIWWEISFLGYTAWLVEIDTNGISYLQKN